MDKLFIYNFSTSDFAMHAPVFKILFPAKIANKADEGSITSLMPENMDDVARCGKDAESGARYVSKAGQDKREIEALG